MAIEGVRPVLSAHHERKSHACGDAAGPLRTSPPEPFTDTRRLGLACYCNLTPTAVLLSTSVSAITSACQYHPILECRVRQVLRVIPYSAAQLYSYELFKRYFQDSDTGVLSVRRRLAAGACAGMASTLVCPPHLRRSQVGT